MNDLLEQFTNSVFVNKNMKTKAYVLQLEDPYESGYLLGVMKNYDNAKSSPHVHIVKYLIERGSSINILYYRTGANTEAAAYLASLGADANQGAMEIAYNAPLLELTYYLHEHRADIHRFNDEALARAGANTCWRWVSDEH